jgi:hypothetical protein
MLESDKRLSRPLLYHLSFMASLVQLLEVLQLRLLHFFGEALPNTFLENSFTREAPEGRIRFLYYRGEAKKVAHPTPLTP